MFLFTDSGKSYLIGIIVCVLYTVDVYYNYILYIYTIWSLCIARLLFFIWERVPVGYIVNIPSWRMTEDFLKWGTPKWPKMRYLRHGNQWRWDKGDSDDEEPPTGDSQTKASELSVGLTCPSCERQLPVNVVPLMHCMYACAHATSMPHKAVAKDSKIGKL